MRFYLATRFLFPRHFHLRIFAICFAAVHLPLISFVASQAAMGEWQWQVFVPLLLATLTGTGGAIVALGALLAPIRQASEMLRQVQHGKAITEIPAGGRDLAGELLDSVGLAALATNTRISQLRDAAERDVLTGLRNRRGFLDAAAHLRSGTRATLALVDIDFFKRINDIFGHDEGDLVLQEFSHRLTETMRRSDLIARWGGEEFAILIPGMGPREAQAMMERLRTALHADPIGPNPEEPVTFSCGLAFLRGPDQIAVAMQRADKALYAAKHGGRDRIALDAELAQMA
ncbi:GGDEF domain-containing protein [Sphingomonas sp. HITSZ_GF]|uniref:GGDEF domain-containing protein n=1 Tax=Sphingomonas sp. HITSZ_GF TaxID=3037247 RepID=UPI00240D788D|nr:GGDEF domain-containing protein [Sphingomonas sp. HITSZ_GF]MDG2535604.1 GGDEF domain-containing protein [Sphingomonas sp. HITSZ_GF]